MNQKTKRDLIYRWLAVIAWMIIIYILSDQPASISDELSVGILDRVFSIFGIDIYLDQDLLQFFNYIIRKSAHFVTFFTLGILLCHAIIKKAIVKEYLIVVGIAFLYAVFDEVHQLFVVGRSGQISDVFIDVAGVLLAVLIYYFYDSKVRQRNQK